LICIENLSKPGLLQNHRRGRDPGVDAAVRDRACDREIEVTGRAGVSGV
jgi:hypothetical protein